jgi:hypothetical protein
VIDFRRKISPAIRRVTIAAIMSAFVSQLEIYGTDFEQNKIEAWTSDRRGGEADGSMMFSGVTSEPAQYFIFDQNSAGSNFIIDAWRIADAPVDVLRLKWDGTNWLELSRSIGDH